MPSTPSFGLLAAIGIREGQALRAGRAHDRHPHRCSRRGQRDGARHRLRTRDPAATSSRTAPGRRVSSAAATSSRSMAPVCWMGAPLLLLYPYGVTPAMAAKIVGIGSQYAGAMVDSEGRALDGGHTYRLHMPPDVPAKDFWSLVLCDSQDPVHAADRPVVPQPQQRARCRAECRRVDRRLLRAECSERQGEQLDPDRPRQGLERHPAAVRASGSLV